MYVSVRSTDGIGIPGHVSAHVNTYLYTHTRASSFDCTHSRCETIVSSSSLSRYIPLLPLPLPSVNFSFISSIAPFPTLLMQMVRSLPGPLLLFFFPSPVFLSLYTDFSFLSYSPTSTIIPTLPQFSSSSSRLISSRSYISLRIILFFVSFFSSQPMMKYVSWNIWRGIAIILYCNKSDTLNK